MAIKYKNLPVYLEIRTPHPRQTISGGYLLPEAKHNGGKLKYIFLLAYVHNLYHWPTGKQPYCILKVPL